MPNNVGAATVDEVYEKVNLISKPTMNDLAAQAVTLTNSNNGVIKNSDGKKSLVQKQ